MNRKSLLSPEEQALLTHVTMFGSAGYPIRKLARGSRWVWDDAFGVKGTPTVYKTKRAAVAAFEVWCSLMRDKLAGRS